MDVNQSATAVKRPYWILAVILAAVIVSFGGYRYYAAEMAEWRLLNRVPTASVEESRRYGVFVSKVNFEPVGPNAKLWRSRIGGMWVEHRVEPKRVNLFSTEKVLHPELILCIEIIPTVPSTSVAMTNEVKIVNANTRRIYVSTTNNVLFTEVGRSLPRNIVLSSNNGDTVVVELKS